MSNRSEYHKQYRLKNKDKLNDYHKKYYHLKKNNDNENEKMEITNKPKYQFTEKRKLAFEKMKEARKKILQEKIKNKITNLYIKENIEILKLNSLYIKL